MKKLIFGLVFYLCSVSVWAQINTDRVLAIGRNALYFEDYVLSIQYFNQVIRSKPWLAEPYFFRAVAKISLDDFKGAEEDCTACLERNPFLAQAYYARGIARQSMEDFDGAIADYEKGLEFKREDRQMMVNEAVAYIQKKDYDGAEKMFERLMVAHPRYSMAYLSRGAMYIEKGDTTKALADYDKAIELDPYYPPAYGNRAIVYYQLQDFDKALADLNEAIHLDPRESGYYINRGLVSYQKNNLKGAMADYDQVISMDHDNLIARFNRGLLRFQVGDNNRAIEDFDVVLQLEPDNYMAYYNRALLRYETGDYPGSVSDFNVVLTEYPDFLPGYYSRAEAKKKMNDLAGADRDVWTAFKKEEQMKKNRAAGKTTASASSGTATTGTSTSGNATDNNTREQSDKNIDKFNRLVVYDKEEERRNKFNSDVRGRVQDRNVRVDLEPQFILTFYEKPDPVKKQLYYSKLIDDFNQQMVLKMKLLITNEEAALTEDQIAAHFASIDDYSARIARNPSDVNSYLGRALDYMLVQDFASAIKDYDKVIELDPNSMIAFFNRAVVRYKQMQYQDSNEEAEIMDIRSDLTMNFNMGGKQTVHSAVMPSKDDLNAIKEEKRSYQHEQITRDYDMAIKLHPDFVYAYFNRGNLRCALRDYRAAIEDYSEAIRRDPEFAEAYFNRGLARLSQGNTSQGIADLSKAGELGIINAYSIIKRMME